MKKNILLLFISVCAFAGCSLTKPSDDGSSEVRNPESTSRDQNVKTEIEKEPGSPEDNVKESRGSRNEPSKVDQPKNVREFFILLPAEYFVIENCPDSVDINCQKSKRDYLKKYAAVEDLKNGYLEAGGDGAQGTFKMAIFRRPDGRYIIGFNSFSESADTHKFLEFSNGNWADISIEIVPEYSTANIYEFPRYGTTIQVFAKRDH
ncbi:MAG: hypothetical protein HKN25_09580 [Pyrinomonadaceae bacterium]|nr:hypothetical protein [Pyrinomonadaceae bacterium]